jgi:hypothetical protein
MNAIDVMTLIAFGIFVLTFISVMLADAREVHRVVDCVRSIDSDKCPKCERMLGEGTSFRAGEKLLKFSPGGVWPLRSRQPSRLVMVICPHCAAELEFRIDGTLFSCDHIMATL